MFIKIDDENNIVEVISVGVKPKKNGYEVESIDENILSDILNYKYINGEFIKNSGLSLEKINKIKNIKINLMNNICKNVIESGINFKNKHYSLTIYDQINIERLKAQAILNSNLNFLYHADNETYQLYSSEDIIKLSKEANLWIQYWLVYFNCLKSEILEMDDIDKIKDIKFGQILSKKSTDFINSIFSENQFNIDPISDQYNYDMINFSTS